MNSVRTVWLFTTHNMYDSKRHFTQKLAEAFRRRGIDAKVLDQKNWISWDPSKGERPDFTCSFHVMLAQDGSRNVQVESPTPHLFLLVDPIFYYMDYIARSGMLISCVDRMECATLHGLGFEHVFFLPHAIERDLNYPEGQERPYDVCFVGSSYDPESFRNEWKEKFSPEKCRVIEDAVEISFSNLEMPFFAALAQSLLEHGMQVPREELFEMGRLVDYYMRGVDRVELIRSIREAPVHIFGGTIYRSEGEAQGWGRYLGSQANVVLHPALDYSRSLEVLSKSKIALNSSPTYRNGSHERVFGALACGAVTITSESLYFREEFVDSEDLFLYRFDKRQAVDDKINFLLAHEAQRKESAEKGRAKVLKRHTWDNRVDAILQFMEARL